LVTFVSAKRKMMKKIICSIGLIVAACSVAVICSSCGKKEERGELKRIWYNGSYNRDFKDLNDVHLAEAKRIGIQPASNREEAEKVKKEMEEIETNEYYEVEKLTHSIPYLIPSAAQLLEDIGHNFQDSLRNLNASIYKVKVTSVTRTVDDVKNLKKRNTNSSQNSAHRYGTTFDVSWARYTKVDESDTLNIDKDRLKMVLAMVLRDLKREERCYVKHERKQGCFHITVREKFRNLYFAKTFPCFSRKGSKRRMTRNVKYRLPLASFFLSTKTGGLPDRILRSTPS